MSTDTTDTQPSETDEHESPEVDASTDPEAATNAEADAASDETAEASSDEEMDEVEALRAERDEINDRLLRTAAELENYRRRSEREKKRRYTSGKVDSLRAILEVLDDFERSINAADQISEKQDAESAYESLKGGVEMVFQKFQDTLKSLGVEPIDAEGEPFDENLHEAMMRQPTDEVEPGTVVQEVRKGYTIGDGRVLRHSRVIVATDPNE